MVGNRSGLATAILIATAAQGCSSSSPAYAICTGSTSCSAQLDPSTISLDCKLTISGINSSIEFDCPDDESCMLVSGPHVLSNDCSRSSGGVTCYFDQDQQTVAHYLGLSNGQYSEADIRATCGVGLRPMSGPCDICDPAL